MALDSIYAWSQTAASNSNADTTINFAEFQTPASLNDSCRALMARVAQFLSDAAPNRSSTGTGNAYAVASDAAGATLTNLEQITFIPHASNTSSCTLDVDGHELSVLKGATETLRKWRPVILVELCPCVCSEHGYEFADLVACFSGLGYRFESFDGRALPDDPVALEKFIPEKGGINVLALPR